MFKIFKRDFFVDTQTSESFPLKTQVVKRRLCHKVSLCCMYVCMYECLYACKHTFLHVCMYVCV